jgi:Na+/H+-translocating membrane pyrophosphatase
MPVAVGFGLGVGALAGFLAGAIGAGALMAVFLANSGGAWDNAKKIVEDGAHGGKGATRTPRPSSATPSATRSRTPLARPSTR